jgi:hypothetical protein
MVRLASKQRDNAIQLAVRQAEGVVQRLFGDLRQVAEFSRAC